jgi:hypothetical protein
MVKHHDHHHHAGAEKEKPPHGFHRAYWKHAHYDWRLWVAVALMLVAIFIFVMSDNLALRPSNPPRQTPTGTVAG